MDFKAENKTIEGLLSSKKQFCIPRFQREYSWGTQELKIFFEDIVGKLTKKDNLLDTSEYFIGSILLVGDMNDQKNRKIDVIDGQQRLTTITILLSALYESFFEEKEPALAEKLWEYIINKDNDLNDYALLSNETPKPFFQFLIQDKKKYNKKPQNTEEENILKAYKYFISQLNIKNLRKNIEKLIGEDLAQFTQTDLLKAIRDQLLRCVTVCIWTSDSKYANMIFEILNAKGKSLASIDLIKNSLFETLNKEEPADEAKEKWKEIKKNLTSRGLIIDFATFYRHFWISKYKKSADKKLYSDFRLEIKNNEESYLNFLDELVNYSSLYVKILKPSLEEDFFNYKHYNVIINSFEVINETFNIVQSRLLLMHLYDIHMNKKLIDFKAFLKAIKFIENFHFIYNAICSKGTNKLEKPYSEISINLSHVTTESESKNALNQFHSIFKEMIPTEEEFIAGFNKLIYSKEKSPYNTLTAYALSKIETSLSKNTIDRSYFTIEHIKNESSEEFTKQIGNLTLLEREINNNMPTGLNFIQKLEIYKKSKYFITDEFILSYNNIKDWNEILIRERTKDLAKELYKNLINN